LITGKGEMLKNSKDNSKDNSKVTSKILPNQNLLNEPNIKYKNIESVTRPRIPLNAAAGSLSMALEGITSSDVEEMPLIHAFANYNYTILVKGDSMEPEFRSGDEVACIKLKPNTFLQWGRVHVLDTVQGIIIKRIYDNEDSILCKSENVDLYKDFSIPKDEVFGIGLVIGMIRRY